MSKTKKGLLPSGWIMAPLSEFAAINPPLGRCIINDDIQVTFVPMRAVEAEGGGMARPEARSYREVKKGYTAFLSSDVIMAKITPCMENGKIAVVPEVPGDVCFGSTEFHVVRAEKGIQPRWISQFLLQHEVRRAAQRQMTGGVGQMRVPAAFLESLSLPVPPSAEQSRIADALDELFSDLDAGVTALERVLEKLKLYRASVLKAAVEGTLTAEWRSKNFQTEPASELLKRILVERRRRWEEDQLAKFKVKGQEPPKDWKIKYKEPLAPDIACLPSLPEDWTWCSGDQLFWFITSGSRGWAKYYTDKGSLFIRMGNLDHGSIKLDLTEIQRVSPPPSAEGLRTQVEQKDILISITADVGMVALVPDDIEEAYINQHVALARPAIPDTGPLMAWYLAGPSGQKRLKDLQRGATKVGLGLDDIRNVVIPLPPVAEQEAIIEAVEDQLSVIDHLEAELEAKLKTSQSLCQSILNHAFTGQLVPQDPKDEPVSELLKRIAEERAARAKEVAAAKRPSKDRKSPRSGHRMRAKQQQQGEK